jgi:hypothetical protein
VVVRDDGHCVFRLKQVAVGGVIDQHNVAEFAVDHTQVFEVETSLESAVLAVEAMGDVLLLGVEVVQDDVGVRSCAGCEDDDFCELRQLL